MRQLGGVIWYRDRVQGRTGHSSWPQFMLRSSGRILRKVYTSDSRSPRCAGSFRHGSHTALRSLPVIPSLSAEPRNTARSTARCNGTPPGALLLDRAIVVRLPDLRRSRCEDLVQHPRVECPGAIAFTSTWCPRISMASVSANRTTAALEAAYALSLDQWRRRATARKLHNLAVAALREMRQHRSTGQHRPK